MRWCMHACMGARCGCGAAMMQHVAGRWGLHTRCQGGAGVLWPGLNVPCRAVPHARCRTTLFHVVFNETNTTAWPAEYMQSYTANSVTQYAVACEAGCRVYV